MPKPTSSNTGSSAGLLAALGGIAEPFRSKIVTQYVDLKHRGRVGDSIGSAGAQTQLCESVLRLLQQVLTGTHIPFGTHIKNFQGECQKLESGTTPSQTNESQRLIIPKALVFLHTMRSKRGTGHVGGDVDANTIDLATAVRLADWVICELLRLYHALSLEEAQSLLNKVSTRQVPDVWKTGDTKRVLRRGLTAKQQVMLLLYGETDPVPIESVHTWMEYSTLSTFRKNVVKPLHKERLIECDPETDMLTLSPTGEAEVEAKLLS